MPTANSQQNRLYRADCKYVLDDLYSEGLRVDLIYLDPPFNSSRIYNMIFNSHGIDAQQKAFHDMWDFHGRTRQLLLDFQGYLEESELPKQFQDFMKSWLNILEQGNSEDTKLLNYLMYMTERLIRMKKILKPTGSIYFHCDSTASHYIKIVMDGIFDRKNFRNEIVWKRATSQQKGSQYDSKSWGTNSDSILFYTKTQNYKLKPAIELTDPNEINKKFPYKNENGERYYDDSSHIFRNPCMGARPNLCFTWKGFKNPHPSGWRLSKARLDEEYQKGNIVILPNGKLQRRKYLKDYKGVPIGNLWTDINPALGKERRGYPTQKPKELLGRIIQASCPQDGTVLDPFCGCGTTIEAAHKKQIKWIGIDISGDAVDEIKTRLNEIGVFQTGYKSIESNPETMAEYNRMNPYEKQDWLIRRIHGFPNPRKSGDQGIDGDVQVHAGFDGEKDHFNQVIFSVKTGKQSDPKHVREIAGTLKQHKAHYGVLILDKDPTQNMEEAADKCGTVKYRQSTKDPLFIIEFPKIQIMTAQEIIDGKIPNLPRTLQAVRKLREELGNPKTKSLF